MVSPTPRLGAVLSRPPADRVSPNAGLSSDLKEPAEDVSACGIGRRRSEHKCTLRLREIPPGPCAALPFCGDEIRERLGGALSEVDLDAIRDPRSINHGVAKEQLPSIEPICVGVAHEGAPDGDLCHAHRVGPAPPNAGCAAHLAWVEENRRVGSLLVVSGPPGSGKSSVTPILAEAATQSVLIEGDAFFGFLASGAIEPWLPASNEQNTVVTKAAASAAGAFAAGGFVTVYDGVVGPWFLPAFGAATGLDRLDYAILLPSVEVCVQRVATRPDHGFTDEAATRKMHAEFVRARVDDRHVLRDPPGDATSVAELVESAREAGELTHTIR